ncbi:MAG: aspartate/glutamate racemase family protein [Burkholderiales bacterium]|nr:aspartate/glutamate racemase family protein [Burkholderiales bacterium]
MTAPTLAAGAAALPPEGAPAGLGRPGAGRGVLGVVMLDTRFPRLPGDIGNPATFAFPVRYRVVVGALPRRVVIDADRSLLEPFVVAARMLEAEGCTAIATSCGFLALFQEEMQAAVAVPLWTSSLLLVAGLQAALPAGQRVGIVTADAGSLTPAHLAAAGAATDTPVEGLSPDSAFHATLLDNRSHLDAGLAEAATVAAALRLVNRHPGLAAIVLECTNMPPYADGVRAATGLPVHDITTLIASRFAAPAR